MKIIYACSSNAGKLRDFQLVTSELGVSEFELLPLPGLKEIAAPEETGHTFEENAMAKAIYYSQFTQEVVLADDSGLEVDALGGAPGVHSARYAGPEATDLGNNELLLQNMLDQKQRRARFVGAIALAQHGRVQHTTRAAVEGELTYAARGMNGFGYDPLFFYPPFDATFGEVDDAKRFSVSHRGLALRQTVAWIAKQASNK